MKFSSTVFSPPGWIPTVPPMKLAGDAPAILGRVLLKLNRLWEAATWAEAPLRGRFHGSSTYATSTELAELAAAAWDAAGVRDSAVTYYRQVVKQWQNAEPAFSARIERARLRLAALSGQ